MNWRIFLLMLPHLKPKCLGFFFPELYRAWDVTRVISLLVLCFLFWKKKKNPSPVTWGLGLLEGWICFVAVLKRGDFVETCSLAVSVMAIALLVDYFADDMKALISTLMLNYEWVVYANLITVLMNPENGLVQDKDRFGHVAIYFFGPDNWFMYLCIPAICIALLYLRFQLALGWKKGILRVICLIFASYASIFILRPATALVAVVIMAVVLAVNLIPGICSLGSFPVVLIGGVAANLGISVFRVMERIPFIADFIQNVLKKGITLSGRTGIWDAFAEQIQGNLLLGIGTPKDGYLIGSRFMHHMHNQGFDLLAQGGVPAVLVFCAVLLLAGRALTLHRKTLSAKILTAGMAGLLMICISEVCRHASIFLLFPLAYHVQKMEAACREGRAEPESSEA